LDLQPPNLAVQCIQVRFILHPPLAPLMLKDSLESVLAFAFPSSDLMWMHFVSPRNLVDHLTTRQRFQRDFKLCTIVLLIVIPIFLVNQL